MTERLNTHSALSVALAAKNEQEIEDLISHATPVHQGIGGESYKAELNGSQIFIKAVPLTDLEQQPENLYSTANVFGLPLYYQYGIGSTGFGVWRELSALLRTTEWVTAGLCPNFPMLFHWRILENRAKFTWHMDKEALEKDVTYWNDSLAVKHRLEALMGVKARVVLFCEYFPMTLQDWLTEEIRRGESRAEKAVDFVDTKLGAINNFMAAQKMVHFDAHFKNIVTDGTELFFSDFGLALSSHFDLSKSEIDFLNPHENYDRALSAINLMHSVLSPIFGHESWIFSLRKFLDGNPDALPHFVRAAAKKNGAIALIMDDFFEALRNKSKLTPYPRRQIDALLAYRTARLN